MIKKWIFASLMQEAYCRGIELKFRKKEGIKLPT